MFLEERQTKILSMLSRQGRLDNRELGRHLKVSAVTLRRDLKALEERGLLKRAHGGVLAPEKEEPVFGLKAGLMAAQKRRIADIAAGLIREGEVICVDSGTTTLCLAPYLADFKKLTVVTNSLDLCFALREKAGIQLIQLGGQYRPLSHSFVGPGTVAALKRLHVHKAFLGASGVTQKQGLMTTDLLEAEVKAAMIAQAKESYLMADSSKLGQPSLHAFSPLSNIKKIITDKEWKWESKRG